MEDVMVFFDDLVVMVVKWVDGGCCCLYLVDLNGVFEGKLVNGEVVIVIVCCYLDLLI